MLTEAENENSVELTVRDDTAHTNCTYLPILYQTGLIRVHSEMIQTGLIQNAHGDLVTDASYDFYGLRLATCSLDQRYGFILVCSQFVLTIA